MEKEMTIGDFARLGAAARWKGHKAKRPASSRRGHPLYVPKSASTGGKTEEVGITAPEIRK